VARLRLRGCEGRNSLIYAQTCNIKVLYLQYSDFFFIFLNKGDNKLHFHFSPYNIF